MSLSVLIDPIPINSSKIKYLLFRSQFSCLVCILGLSQNSFLICILEEFGDVVVDVEEKFI